MSDVEPDEQDQEAKLGKKTPKANGKAPPRVSVAAIVGGMSAQKQRRVLDRGVDVLVATPGRLWDLLGEVRTLFAFSASLFDPLRVAFVAFYPVHLMTRGFLDTHIFFLPFISIVIMDLILTIQDDVLASEMKELKFLVLDEADRMIETGHFAEMENIVRLTLRQSRSV